MFQLILPFQLELPFETEMAARAGRPVGGGHGRGLARTARPKRPRGERQRAIASHSLELAIEPFASEVER